MLHRPRRERARARLRGIHSGFICTRVMRQSGRLGTGRVTGTEAAYEGPLIDCPRCIGARCRQRLGDHEQRLQGQPSRMVRSSFRRPAPREDETQLTKIVHPAHRRQHRQAAGVVAAMTSNRSVVRGQPLGCVHQRAGILGSPAKNGPNCSSVNRGSSCRRYVGPFGCSRSRHRRCVHILRGF